MPNAKRFLSPCSQLGFTLIELLVVVLIIGVLIAVSAPAFLSQTEKAHDSATKQHLTVAYKAATAWAVDHHGGNTAADAACASATQGSFCSVAGVIGGINASEPELTAIDGSVAGCPAAAVNKPDNEIYVSAASAGVLTMCADPDGRVWTLKVQGGVLQGFDPVYDASSSSSSSGPVSNTDPDGNATTVTSPNGGPVSVGPTSKPAECVADCSGWTITTPTTSASDPNTIVITVTGGGSDSGTIVVKKDGATVPDCAAPGVASPDPCVDTRTTSGGDAVITVLSAGDSGATYTTEAASSGSSGVAEGPSTASAGDIRQISSGSSGNNLSNTDFSTPMSWTTSGIVIENDANWPATEIDLVDPVTGAATPLPGLPTGSYAPVASPDGSKIAYTDEAVNLYVYDMASHVSTLVAHDYPGRWVARSWSPDGSKIAWGTNDPNFNADIYYAKADGSTDKVNLTNTATTNLGVDTHSGSWAAAWSPDGTKIAFSRNGYIKTVDLSGNVTDLVAPTGGGFNLYPAWAANGTLAFLNNAPSSGNDVLTANSSGGAVTTLTHLDAGGTGYDPQLAFSPDNSYLGAVAGADDDVFSIKVSDGTLTNLTPGAGTGAGSCCTGVGGAFTWSPSGHWILYAGNPGDVYAVKVY